MQCVICGEAIVFQPPEVTGTDRRPKIKFDPNYLNQSPYCPKPKLCGDAWRSRHPHLFKVRPEDPASLNASSAGALTAALRSGMGGWLEDKDFAALHSVSKEVRSFSLPNQLKDARKAVKHFDKSTPDGVDVLADQMLEIALLAYQGALEVKAMGKPIILYRVADKSALSLDEKLQTLSGRIRVRIGSGSDSKEVWPLEKTAAWIQGALRAKASFLLLSDPRGDLEGGKDGHSDAVYVRELHQILGSFYLIAEASDDELTDKMRRSSTRAFILKPRQHSPSAPVPLIPKMSRQMGMSNTWDSSVSSLTLSDSPFLIRASLRGRFVDASAKLGGIPPY